MTCWTLRDFLRESLRIEGIHRAPTKREIDATEAFVQLPALTIRDVGELVSVYAPGHSLRDRPGLDVRVGNYIAPRGGPAIRDALEGLLGDVNTHTWSSWQIHMRYERLHPFTDGNGRSGRAIWLWQRKEAPIGFLHQFYYETLRLASSVPNEAVA